MRKIFTIFSVIAVFILTSFQSWFASKPDLYQTPDIAVSSIVVENAGHIKKWQSVFVKTTLHVSWFRSWSSIKLDSFLKSTNGAILETCAWSFPITRRDTRMSWRETIVKTCRFDYFKTFKPNGDRFNFTSIGDKSNHIRETNEHNNSASTTLRVWKPVSVCEHARKQPVCGRRGWTRKTFNSLCELQEAGYTYDSVWTCSTRPPVDQPPYERPTFPDDYSRTPIDLSYDRPRFSNDYKRHPINTHYSRTPIHTHYDRAPRYNSYSRSHRSHNYNRSHYYHSNYRRDSGHDSYSRSNFNYNSHGYHSHGWSHYNNSSYDSVNYSYNDRNNYGSYDNYHY